MTQKHQEDLVLIRSMMEQSSRFISLSGLSGIIAGVLALAASGFAFYFMNAKGQAFIGNDGSMVPGLFGKLTLIAVVTLAGALFSGIFFTVQKTKKNQTKVWTSISRRLLIALVIPLSAGGIFCLALMYHGLFGLVAPATLIFYGLALVNAAKFTLNDVAYLGYCELALGLVALFFIGYGLAFWAAGFGVLHVIYGVLMEKKYR